MVREYGNESNIEEGADREKKNTHTHQETGIDLKQRDRYNECHGKERNIHALYIYDAHHTIQIHTGIHACCMFSCSRDRYTHSYHARVLELRWIHPHICYFLL